MAPLGATCCCQGTSVYPQARCPVPQARLTGQLFCPVQAGRAELDAAVKGTGRTPATVNSAAEGWVSWRLWAELGPFAPGWWAHSVQIKVPLFHTGRGAVKAQWDVCPPQAAWSWLCRGVRLPGDRLRHLGGRGWAVQIVGKPGTQSLARQGGREPGHGASGARRYERGQKRCAGVLRRPAGPPVTGLPVECRAFWALKSWALGFSSTAVPGASPSPCQLWAWTGQASPSAALFGNTPASAWSDHPPEVSKVSPRRNQ